MSEGKAARSFWIVLAIILFYLIARPHIGQVWHIDASAATKTTGPSPLPDNPFIRPTPQPLIATGVSAPTAHYLSAQDCNAALGAFEQAAGVEGAYCVAGNGLLWGW
jgi:hypothetical protein